MNKQDLISEVASETGMTASMAEKAVKAVLGAIMRTVAKNESVQLVGFGTFDLSHCQARTGRNPQTGETIQIAACNRPHFKAGKAFKEAVN